MNAKTDQDGRKMDTRELERLRELLFGTQMEEYARHFHDIERDIKRATSDLEQLQNELHDRTGEQFQRHDNLANELQKTAENLNSEIQALDIREAKADAEGKLHLSQHDQSFADLQSELKKHKAEYERKLSSLKNELRDSEDNLRSEYRRVADRLEDQKTDRRALAIMLMEVAKRLETGESVINLLEELPSSGEDA